LNMRPNLPLLF